MTDYDVRYREWIAPQGPEGLDLTARLAALPWRHRMLLRRYPVRGRRVLDYGCGDGVFCLALARAGAEVVGFDVSAAALAQARRFAAGSTGVHFTAVPPEPDTFDLVFCTEVLEHIEDDRAFAAQLLVRVRPGGRLVGTTPVGRAFWDPDHRHIYDAAGLAAILEPLGQVRIMRRYRSRLRNWLPWPQDGAAVFLFEVVRPA